MEAYLTYATVKMKETKLSRLAVPKFLGVPECLEYQANNNNYYYHY